MGGRAGGSGIGLGSRVSGRGRYGDFSRTLGDEINQYNKAYSQVEKELGDTYRKQAAAASTEMLQKFVSTKPQGVEVVKSEWNKNVKLAKSGDSYLDVVSHESSDWGRSWMKSVA
jgi:hypothetical protein